MGKDKSINLPLIHAAKDIFYAAVEGVSGSQLENFEAELPISGFCRVVGAGKASMAMAGALEHKYPDCTFEGHVVVPHGYRASFPESLIPPKVIKVLEGGHPVPDAYSQRAAGNALEIAQKSSREEQTLIVLLSGGASALWTLPANGLTMEDLRKVNQLLLESGVDIHQINKVRKHLSAIKAGRLAEAAWPANTITLAISDVVGNDESVIGSGPTVADPTTWEEAMDIIKSIGPRVPASILNHMKLGLDGLHSDTPKPGSEKLQRSQYYLIASNQDALKAAESTARRLGFHVVGVDQDVYGEARYIGARMARKAMRLAPGECFLWGGETTVNVKGNGKGGRNQELVLSAACELKNSSIHTILLSGGTDGIDGPTDAAGGWVTSGTVATAQFVGLDPYVYLQENDSYTFLKALDQILITGPTHTNVMDIGIALRAHE